MLSENIAKIVAKVVKMVLMVEANTCSCIWQYELTVPNDLKKFKYANKKYSINENNSEMACVKKRDKRK